jgi:hypothetical protein
MRRRRRRQELFLLPKPNPLFCGAKYITQYVTTPATPELTMICQVEALISQMFAELARKAGAALPMNTLMTTKRNR